jgi:TatD DNase family protein
LNKKNKIVAIGETGLDYHYSDTNKEQQKLFFIKHIEIAKEFNLPLMVHVRDAHDDAIDVLTKYATGIKVIIHCYSGDRELVEKYTRLGFYISIPGIITFRNALLLKDAIKAIPPQLLLSETDAP